MRFYFPLLFIIVLKLSAASGLFSYKLWNKQRLISEVVKNYLLSCQRLDILKNVENLKKVFQLGIVQNVNFWEQLEILVDLPKFCDQKELMSAKSGHLDCFEMPKNGNLLRLLNEYKIQVDKNEKFIRRLLVCKLIFRMDRPKVSEKNVKALIADFLIEERNRPIYFESKINKSVNSTSKENMEDVDSEHNKRLVLIDYEASEWQLRLENLLNNLYHLYKKSEIITGLQTNIKTKINIKKNDVGTNVRMQTSIHSERHLNDACKILKNNTEIFDLVEAHLVNKADRSNIETIFNNIKGIEIKIHRKILKRNKNSRYGSSSSENNTIDNSKCISDLVTLTAIIELYQSLIDAIAQRIQTLEDNSYKIFCPEKNSNCSKDDLMRVLFKMRKKAELLNASINSWFKRKLVKNEYEELQYQLRSKVDGHFPILIIDNEMPKHRGIVARMEDGLRKIRNQIYQPTWEASKNKKKMGKQGRNRYRYFNSTPRIKKIYKHKPRILYVVDEPSRPAYYYQKRLKRGFWNN